MLLWKGQLGCRKDQCSILEIKACMRFFIKRAKNVKKGQKGESFENLDKNVQNLKIF